MLFKSTYNLTWFGTELLYWTSHNFDTCKWNQSKVVYYIAQERLEIVRIKFKMVISKKLA